MSGLAVVVLAHRDPEQLGHLLRALRPAPVVLHVDAKVDDATFAGMVAAAGTRDDVVLAPRRRTDLASWSLVAAELDALRTALRTTTAEHVVVMSGSDYPLASVETIEAELSARPGTRLWNVPMPFTGWDAPRHADGGMWRLTGRFVVRDDRLVLVAGVPLRWPGRRRLPAGLELRGGSQWKVYRRADAEAMLELMERRPELERHWRGTLVPEETFVPTLLASLPAPHVALLPQDRPAWFVHWPHGNPHPEWLTEADVPDLLRQRQERALAGEPPLLFARKVDSTRGRGFRERVDELLRGAPSRPGGHGHAHH